MIVAAPVKEADVLNIVVGINHHLYDPAQHPIVTAASCTTNCLAPVVKVVHEALGIRHGQITTIHDPTNTNVVVDAPHKDLRRARSAMLSLQPTTTGSATAIALIYPELKGKLDGHAVRAPVLNASLTDCVFELNRATTRDEVNALFRAAAGGSARRHPRAMSRGLWSRPTMPATPAPPSSTAFPPSSPMARCSRSMPGTTTRWAMPAAWSISPATCGTPGSEPMTPGTRNYAIVTAAYWGFTLTDGALRMLVLLHFFQLGYSPFTLSFLFLLYEAAGIAANFIGGWLATRFGITRMLTVGLSTQIAGFLVLSALSPELGCGSLRGLGGRWRRASAASPRT